MLRKTNHIFKEQVRQNQILKQFLSKNKPVFQTYQVNTSMNMIQQKVINFNPKIQFNFSEPPKGFGKYQRRSSKSKPTETKQEESQEKTEKQEENKVQKEENENNKETQEQDKEEKSTQKKKVDIKYTPKFFGFGNEKDNNKDKKENEKEKENEDEKDEKKSDKKDDKQSDFFEQVKDFKPDPKIVAAVLLGAGVLGYYAYDQIANDNYISYTEFVRDCLQTGQISKIIINRVTDASVYKTYAIIHTNNGDVKKLILGNVDHFLENLEKFQIEKGTENIGSMIPISFEYSQDANKMFDRVINLIYLGATLGIMYALFKSLRSSLSGMGKGGQDFMGMSKSNVKQFGGDSKITTRFKDVAGQDEAKVEIQEFVDFLKKPKKYKNIGAKLPRGALLTGPPGTGKTLLAKACAGEADVPFFYISGSDFVEMFVGVGASRVRDLFKQAKAKSPSIIFIDEIDAVGRKRENKVGGNDERDNTLNQLLVELDGFGTDTNVIVLAATNMNDLLDKALTRPGRFDRTIEITLPDIEGRKKIFLVHLQPLKLDSSRTLDEYAKRLATLTPGFSGADIANLCNEAAILAARNNKVAIEAIDFEMATERVLAGLEKKRIPNELERRTVAYHECGHAVASWFLEGGHPLLKLTIIPRTKGSLGFAQYLPNEMSLETKEELLDRLCTILGGRVAEELFFTKITTGAYDDLKKAYELAFTLVTKYGMSEKLGYVGYMENEYSKTYSDATNKLIDDEIKRLIDEATVKTRELLESKRELIESLAESLLEKETLDLKQINKILGERPFLAKSNFKAYLEVQNEDEIESQDNNNDQNNDSENQNQQATTATLNPPQ